MMSAAGEMTLQGNRWPVLVTTNQSLHGSMGKHSRSPDEAVVIQNFPATTDLERRRLDVF